MTNLISFLSDFWNGYTLIDIFIMLTLSILLFRSNKKVKSKNQLLKFYDIAIEQEKEENAELKKELAFVNNQNDILQKKYLQKNEMLSRCIDRPKVNGKFVKKDYKPIIAFKAKENVYNSKGLKVFTESIQYPQTKAKALTLIGDDAIGYVIDRRKFEPVY